MQRTCHRSACIPVPFSFVHCLSSLITILTISKASYVAESYAQVTHSRIWRRISHGYDPASSGVISGVIRGIWSVVERGRWSVNVWPGHYSVHEMGHVDSGQCVRKSATLYLFVNYLFMFETGQWRISMRGTVWLINGIILLNERKVLLLCHVTYVNIW